MTTTPCTNPFCHDGQCTVEHAGSSATVDCSRCAGTGVIAASPQPVAVSGEWVMVPRTATPNMLIAGYAQQAGLNAMPDIWAAMLAASPHPEPESAAPAVSDEAVEAAEKAYAFHAEYVDHGDCLRAALAAAFQSLTAQVASLTAERDAYRNAVAGHSERWEAAEAQVESLGAQNEKYRGELAWANNSFGSQTADWPGLAARIEDVKKYANEQWLRAEAAEQDAERLRAVTAHGWRVAYASPGWCVFARNGQAITGIPHPTYGAAIDAARAATKEPT